MDPIESNDPMEETSDTESTDSVEQDPAEEWKELFEQLDRIQQTHTQIIDQLQHVQSRILPSDQTIYVLDPVTQERMCFETILQQLHQKSLDHIRQNQPPSFAQEVLYWIDHLE